MKRPIVVCLGVSHRDLELACLWLKWVSFLFRQPGVQWGHVVVVYTQRTDPMPLHAAGYGMPSLNVVACPDADESGYPKSASHLFVRTLEAAGKLFPGYAVLWCEADCWPLRATWFGEIADEYQTCGKPNMGALVGSQYPHQGGNSIYAADWRTRFPSITSVLSAPDYKLWGPGKGQPWDVWCRHETTPQMAESKLWHHVWKEREIRVTRLADIPKAACLFHQDKTGALIREIAAKSYPDFMASLTTDRRFYFMNGHPNRLMARGLRIKFSHTEHKSGFHRSAVCSDEMPPEHASALATLVGKLGVREIDEAEFRRITGRSEKSVAAIEPRARPVGRTPDGRATHPNVFVMLGRYGDVINCLPFLKAEADAGRRPTLVVSKDFQDILDGVSYCDRIVWDGAYEQLPECLRWLRRDKGIVAPVVAQYHRNPLDKGRLTDSYQKEIWRLAGRLDQFETRGPLVFDRRNQERETALVWGQLGERDDNPPVVLVGLHSISSPLPQAQKILDAIRKRWPKYTVIDLATVKAERPYDLLGLYETASLIVSADTMHGHLARAVKRDLLALANDNWRGSTFEHATQIVRYADVTPQEIVTRAEQILFAPTLTTIHYPPVGLTPTQVVEMAGEEWDRDSTRRIMEQPSYKQELATARILHVVDVFGSDVRHHVAQATWTGAYREGMTPVHVRAYPRDAKTELGDPRALPFLKDILRAGIDQATSGEDIIAWSNSDVGLKAGFAAALTDHMRQTDACTMRRTESNGHDHLGRDLMAFRVKWLEQHWAEIPDYILGVPVFDLGLVAMVRRHCGVTESVSMANVGKDMPPAEMPPGWALHESHTSEWLVRSHHTLPATRHNHKLFVEWAKKYAPRTAFTKGGNLK